MKSTKFIIIAFLTVFSQSVFSQVDRSKAPEPGPVPEFSLGDFSEFELDNGLKVIVVENHKLPRISYQLVVDRKPIYEGEKAGYLSFAGDLLSAGTKTLNKVEFDEEVDFLGARFITTSSMVYFSGLSRHSDRLFELLADVTLNPAFPQEELDKLKTQALSALQANKEDPGSIARNVAAAVNFGKDHPYGEVRTEKSINRIELEDCIKYYEDYFNPSQSYLVIVGDIDLAKAKKLTKKHLGEWKDEIVQAQESPKNPGLPSQTKVALSHRSSSVQSVLRITYPIDNEPGTKESIEANVMNAILGGSSFGARLMQNLREDKAYTYGCRSNLGSDEYVATFEAYASVRNEVTDSAIVEILKEMQGMIAKKATEDELERVKAAIKGRFSRSLERPQTIAGMALRIKRYNLPEDYYNTYLTKVEAVTLDDVKKAAEKFLKPGQANIVVVGDATEVAPTLEKFGPITYYDAFGFETEAPQVDLPEGLDAKRVLKNAIIAAGGSDRIESVKKYTLEMEASTQMGTLKLYQQAMPKKDRYYQRLSANGQTLNKLVMNKDEFYSKNPQGERELSEDEKESLRQSVYLHQEVIMMENLDAVELTGADIIDGQKVAVLSYSIGESMEKRYYSLESGLLVATSSETQGQTVTRSYKEYENYDGIMLPTQISNSALPFTFEIKEVKINEKIDKKLFKF